MVHRIKMNYKRKKTKSDGSFDRFDDPSLMASTSTLILPRAEASQASDLINMVKTSLFTVKT